MLLAAGESRDFDLAQLAQRVDDVLDQDLRRGRAGGDPDRFRVLDPFRRKLAAVGNEIARNAGLGADLAQPIGIGTILGADDENHIDVMTEFPHRRLPVLGGVADVSDLRPDDVVIAPFERGNDAASVVDAQRGLRDIGDRRIGGNIQGFDVLFTLHQHHGPSIWPSVPSTSGCPAWPTRMSTRPWAT